MKKTKKSIADYIRPLNMNGMQGRMLYMPAPERKKNDILIVYGQHSSLERWWGLYQFANRYGAVTAPDLPGFGGMDSFHKIGKAPTIDNFADYLAAFIKLRYKRRKIIIIGLSFGFVVATRMLQRYPELATQVQLMVSLVGFTHRDDFILPKKQYWTFRTAGKVFKHALPAFILRYGALNRWVLRRAYPRMPLSKGLFALAKDKDEYEQFLQTEMRLWQDNDVRTHARTAFELLTLDNCQIQVRVPVWHIAAAGDQYFDPHRVEQHMRVVFPEVTIDQAKLLNHAPSVIANEKEAAALVPAKLRKALKKL